MQFFQGICPGNRLRLLAGVYDSGQKSNEELNSPLQPQLHGKRRSWQSQSNKVRATCCISNISILFTRRFNQSSLH